MKITVKGTKQDMGAAAAKAGAELLRKAIDEKGEAHIIVATGASQLDMLGCLINEPGIRWDRVTVFHLDEYVGLPIEHPASFRGYLWSRFHSKLPLPVRAFHYIDGEDDAPAEAKRIGALIREHPIDVAFIGIGENAHIAFNDPPADFDTDEPYIIVTLDRACRQQQFGEGWFESLDAVPDTAVSMSVKQIMASKSIICTVPDERKAQAVKACIEGPVTNDAPASILQQHDQCSLFLDAAAASGLSRAHA